MNTTTTTPGTQNKKATPFGLKAINPRRLATASRRSAVLLLLLYAIVGIPTAAQNGCTSFKVYDPATHTWHEATPDEAKALVQDVGNTAQTVTTAIGFPQAAPFIQIATQIAALILAWSIRPKEKETKNSTPQEQ